MSIFDEETQEYDLFTLQAMVVEVGLSSSIEELKCISDIENIMISHCLPIVIGLDEEFYLEVDSMYCDIVKSSIFTIRECEDCGTDGIATIASTNSPYDEIAQGAIPREELSVHLQYYDDELLCNECLIIKIDIAEDWIELDF